MGFGSLCLFDVVCFVFVFFVVGLHGSHGGLSSFEQHVCLLCSLLFLCG